MEQQFFQAEKRHQKSSERYRAHGIMFFPKKNLNGKIQETCTLPSPTFPHLSLSILSIPLHSKIFKKNVGKTLNHPTSNKTNQLWEEKEKEEEKVKKDRATSYNLTQRFEKQTYNPVGKQKTTPLSPRK